MEISKLLTSDRLKNTEKMLRQFDIDCKEIKAKFTSDPIPDKKAGIQILINQFGKCKGYED